MENFKLWNGVEIPAIGFGTYKSTVEEGKTVILRALEAGYRHLDTAAFYGNEELIGESIKDSKIPRDQLFLTSKVWKTRLGYDNTIKSFEESLKKLGTDYLDLFLIHWPAAAGHMYEDPKATDQSTWKALDDLYESGKIRGIGLSNFLPHHYLGLMETAKIKPMVNQLEFHPGYTQQAAVDFFQAQGIVVEGWSPIGRARVLDDPLILKLAEKYGKNPGQICLRFAVQRNVLPLPKSSSVERMKMNQEVFDFQISEEDMYRLLTMPQTGWSGEHPDL